MCGCEYMPLELIAGVTLGKLAKRSPIKGRNGLQDIVTPFYYTHKNILSIVSTMCGLLTAIMRFI